MAQHLDDAAVGAPVSSETDAMAALENWIDSEGEEPPVEDDEIPEGEADEGDTPEADEPEEDDSEDEDEPATPAIDPPASLTADEKAAFAQLPPEAQLMLKTVEARRTTETQQGLEKARNAQRDAESAAAQRVANAQRLFAEQQAQIASAYAPQKPDARQFPDWHSYSAAEAEYNQRAAQHDTLMQQLAGLHDEATKEEQRIEAENMQRMVQAVRDELPELADTAKFQELMTKLTPLALELGYPEDLLSEASPVDIRAIKRAAAWKDKASKYDALMARQMTKVRAGRSAKPNAAQPLGSGKARASASAVQKARETGSIEDAAAALAGF